MEIYEDKEFRAKLIDMMVAREFAIRRGTHCSDLIYCLNKQALRRLKPKPADPQDILRFSVGWATQRWLTEQAEVAYVVDGITVTPDASEDGIPWELKATYSSSTKPLAENFPWIRQIMAQCKVTGSTSARLTRFELMGDWKWVYGKKEEKAVAKHPTLTAFRLDFTPEELKTNWQWMLGRKGQFELILSTGTLLPPVIALPAGQAYECSYCEYKDECQQATQSQVHTEDGTIPTN